MAIPPPPNVLTESIGQRLRRARLHRGLSLDSVARNTRISQSQIQLLEQGNFQNLPGEVYCRGFVRAIAYTVGIDSNEALAHYTSERRAKSTTLHPPKTLSANKTPRVGLIVACSVFLLLLVVATLAISRPRPHSAPGTLSVISEIPTPFMTG